MAHLPQNPRDLRRLFARAMAGHAAVSADEIDDEHLALLAAGLVDELPAHARAAVLEQVACQPWAAQLLAESTPVAGRAGHPPLAGGPPIAGRRPPSALMIGTFVAWGLAACLTLAAGVWRFADRGVAAVGGPTVGTYSTRPGLDATPETATPQSVTPGPGQYWERRDRLAHRAVPTAVAPPPRRTRDVRDVTLLVLALTWLLLSIPVVVWLVRRVRRG